MRNNVLSLIRAMHTKDRAASAPVHAVQQDASEVTSSLNLAISSVFCLLEHVMFDIADFWDAEDVARSGQQVLEILRQQIDGGSYLINAAYWLVVRLGTSPNLTTSWI
jgi:hypothetical protein